MGQFGPLAKITTTHPNAEWGPIVRMHDNAGVVTVTFSGQQLVTGSNAAVFARLYYSPNADGSGYTQIGSQTATFDALTAPVTKTWTVSSVPGSSYIFVVVGSNTSGNTNSVDVQYDDDLTYCAYGAQLRSDVPGIIMLAPELFVTTLGLVTNGLWWAIFAFFAGQALDIRNLCSVPRRTEVVYTLQDYTDLLNVMNPTAQMAAARKAMEWIKWVLWPVYCECTPGALPTVPEPIIPQPNVPGAPLPPSLDYTCDEAELCTQLRMVVQIVNALAQRLSITQAMVQLIQRQHVPFSYVPGVNHVGLSGNGSFAVQAILGLSVSITAAPGYIGSDMDALARSSYFFGWLNLGTSDGYQRKIMLSHGNQLELEASAAITLVEYQLAPGVTASMRELVREP